ncbi:MAG: LuxR family transcriptional regulator [Anaerolineales bacterium]|nr:LuxR family transcriptional regulator [Anaerolineales bacterium]
MSLFVENEYLQPDYIKFHDMLRQNQFVALLSEATRNELQLSQRYRDMLAPINMKDELRAAFVNDKSCWGILCLHADITYGEREASFIASLAPHIADGLRKSLLLETANITETSDAPGVLILTDDLSVVAMTAAAEYWLAELSQAEQPTNAPLPVAVRSVVAGLQAIERGTMPLYSTPKVRICVPSGQWLVLYASRLKQSDIQSQISVVFEVAQPAEITPIIMQAYRLTKRETEIAHCVLRGWSTGEIVTQLHISSNTVQDHLKAIFEKVDVSSRGELAARIFTKQYLPHYKASFSGDSSS